MRNAILPLVLLVVGCAPLNPAAVTVTFEPHPSSVSTVVSRTPGVVPSPTATRTLVPTETSQFHEHATTDCFPKSEFIIGKSTMSQVRSAWGAPTTRLYPFTNDEWWGYDMVGLPRMHFVSQVLEWMSISLEGCTFGEIVDKLGPPEKLDISVWSTDFGPITAFVSQNLDYPSRGFYYSYSETNMPEPYVFRATESAERIIFITRGKVLTDRKGFNSSDTVYDWHGFDVNIELIEDKNPLYPWPPATFTPP